MAELSAALTAAPHAFLQPSLPLYTDTLAYLKHALDPLAADVSGVQQQRQRDERKKRKRGDVAGDAHVLRLKQIHTQGLGVQQVWEQARRVIDAARREAERAVAVADAQAQDVALANGVPTDEEDLSEGSDDESLGEEGVDYEVEGVDDDDDLDLDGERDDFDEMDEGVQDEDDEEINLDDVDVANDEQPDEFVSDKFGLNDGFFSIDNFNKQSEFLEQQDERGDNDGAGSDEEDVDWDTNPLAGQDGLQDGEDDVGGEDDEDGPTFGDPDASSEDEDEPLDEGAMDGMGTLANTNDIMYADFFAPPAQKKKKNKKGRPNPHNFPEQPVNPIGEGEGDDDVDRTMAAVHRDLLEDDSEAEEDEDDNLPDVDASDAKSRRSAHERRRAALQEEIRKLEAANVAKREWTLSGEARAADRPVNSLLEEDLDFERAGKPVPVITAEVSESIEDLIKRRILAHDFQDIVRRRPDDLNAGPRRGKLDFELDDSKSKKGLADEYEEEHLRATDPNFVDASDEKMRKEEREVEALWQKVCADLDSLSSWHFRPKRPAPQLDVRVDAPVVRMEDARPSGAGAGGEASQLAPQEVYRGGEASKGGEARREEVVGKSGLPAGREEMGRDERKRRRRREKERKRKAEGNKPAGPAAAAGKGAKQKAMLGDLKRGGVKVVGRKGDVRDVEGNAVNGAPEAGSGGNAGGRYKL